MQPVPWAQTHLVSRRSLHDQCLTGFSIFMFNLAVQTRDLSFFTQLTIFHRIGQHQHSFLHLHIPGHPGTYWGYTVGGWFSEMCVPAADAVHQEKQELFLTKVGLHAKHLKRVVKCFIGT